MRDQGVRKRDGRRRLNSQSQARPRFPRTCLWLNQPLILCEEGRSPEYAAGNNATYHLRVDDDGGFLVDVFVAHRSTAVGQHGAVWVLVDGEPPGEESPILRENALPKVAQIVACTGVEKFRETLVKEGEAFPSKSKRRFAGGAACFGVTGSETGSLGASSGHECVGVAETE